MNNRPIRFNSQGVYASDSRLASIAAECLAAERAAIAARRAALAPGAQESTWQVNWWVVDGERDVGQLDEWSSVDYAHSMAQHGVRLVRQCASVKVAPQMC